MPPAKHKASVFISYSHKDEAWKDRLATHLGVLQGQSLLDFWEDRQIQVGSDWLAEIQTAMAAARVVLLLVSANSLTSSFILNEEVRHFLQRRATEGLHVVPIIIKPCAWDAVEWLARVQVRPKDGRPLSAGSDYQIDADLTLIAKEVHGLLTARDDSNRENTEAQNRAEWPKLAASSRVPDRYEFLHEIYEGHYSRVAKCRSRDSGEVCIIKDTAANRVSTAALHVLKDLKCPNLVAPRRIWEENGRVFEELPYVGGVRLSSAVAPGIGGLRGAVLESFCRQVEATLAGLHHAQVLHRDIHPDNIYLVIVKPDSEFSSPMIPTWNYDGFGQAKDGFLIAWVIVDCSSAALVSEAPKSRFSHGPYTPEEQACGPAVPGSDMYAYGATLYYGITGINIPFFQTRRLNPGVLASYPGGGHTARGFPEYLESLLSLDASKRPQGFSDMRYDTICPQYQGTLEISDSVLLHSWDSSSETRLLSGEGAIQTYRAQLNWAHKDGDEWLKRDAEHWIKRLTQTADEETLR